LGKTKGEFNGTDRLVACDDRNIVIEAVKKAEDANAIIVRAYECHNSRGTAAIHCAKEVRAAYICDIMENEIGNLVVGENGVEFDYKPFEILTIKLVV
jgi:alpha-mannosidase